MSWNWRTIKSGLDTDGVVDVLNPQMKGLENYLGLPVSTTGKIYDVGGALWNIRNPTFGCHADGVTVDDAALEAVLTACSAGDTIVFPPATYLLDSVTLTKPVTLYGPGAVFKKSSATVGHMFPQVQGDKVDGLRVIGIEFNMNRTAFTNGDTVSPFFFVRARNLLFQDIHVRDGIEEGLKLYSCQYVRVINSKFANIRNNGIQFHIPATDGYSGGVRAKADAVGLWVQGCYFEDIDDGAYGTLDGHGITMNGTDTTYRMRDAVIQGNVVRRCIRGIWGEFGGGSGMKAARNITITGNVVCDSDFFGIGLVSAENSLIANNVVVDTGYMTPNPPTTSDEVLGIVVSGDSYVAGGRVIVKDNVIVDTRGGSAYMETGIVIRRGAGHVVRDNIVYGETVEKLDVVWADVSASEITNATPPMCKATGTSSQTIPDSAWTAVTWGAEEYDSDAMHDNSTNPDRITFNTAGRYRVSAGVSFASNAVGIRCARVIKYHAGDTTIAEEMRAATNGDDTSFTLTATTEVDEADIGDYVRLDVYQSSTGNLDIARSAARMQLAVEWIGGKVL
jgi:parallel beta-helix repeat protein